MPSFPRLVAAATTLVVLTSTAACGGDGGGGVSLSDYANQVCTAIGDWQQQVQDLGGAVQADPPTDPTTGRQVLTDFAIGVHEATTTMVDEVEGVGAPDIDDGEAIHDSVVEGLRGMEEQFAQFEEDMTALPEDDPAAFAEATQGATGQLQAGVEQLGQTFESIDEEYPEQSSELEAAFDDEPACASVSG